MNTKESASGYTFTITQDVDNHRRAPSLDDATRARIQNHINSIDILPGTDSRILDIRTSDYTLWETMYFIALAQGKWPSHEIFMDGDEYAIMARRV